jgi:hypothetical protein
VAAHEAAEAQPLGLLNDRPLDAPHVAQQRVAPHGSREAAQQGQVGARRRGQEDNVGLGGRPLRFRAAPLDALAERALRRTAAKSLPRTR